MMDDAMIAEVRAQIVYERSRTAPPEGFPKLPDLPLARYTDESMFQLEIDHVFRRTWLYAGHESEFPEPGSYRVIDLPYARVIVARGNDGHLRAFLNACRHRGAPVVRDVEGKARLLVCQFHSWSYHLDGELARVPEERDFVGLQRSERSLTSVRCETWAGSVFVNLDEDALPLQEWLEPIQRRYTDLLGSPFQCVTRQSYEQACNWKIVVEAFIEAYHIPTIHRQTAAPFVEPAATAIQLHPHGHSSMFVPFSQQVLEAGDQMREMFYPPSLPKADLPDIYGGDTSLTFSVFPNMVVPMDMAAFPILLFWPLSIDRTRVDMVWYGLDWGGGLRPEGWEAKLNTWDILMAEDFENLAPIQKSVASAAHKGIPLSYQERRIWHFHAELDRWLGADRIPEDLRVPDLLADYVEP